LLGQANGYFNYWNNVPGYYSFNTSGWHIVSLNANGQYESTAPGSAQYQWFSQDLAANTSACTLVFWHQPYFNIGSEGSPASSGPLWSLAAQNRVDIVLNGHDHDYQRWVPLDASGQPSSSGATEFVDGTGGHAIQTFLTSDSRVAKGYDSATSPLPYGALKLNLYATKATYQFINIAGTLLDSGTINCHRASSVTPTPSPTPLPTQSPTPIPTATPTPTPIPTVGGGPGFKIFLPNVVR
jgi:hypothetical protein